MGPTWQESWARSVLRRNEVRSGWLTWPMQLGGAACWLALAVYWLARLGETPPAWVFFFAPAHLLLGLLWWERDGFRRLLAAKEGPLQEKEADIQWLWGELRGRVPAPPPEPSPPQESITTAARRGVQPPPASR
jgi:hypothetical protein